MKAPRTAEQMVDGGDLFFMVPPHLRGRVHLNEREVAEIIGFSKTFVAEETVDSAAFESYGPLERERCKRRYTLRGVLLWIARRLNTDPGEHYTLLLELVNRLPQPERRMLAIHLAQTAHRP